MNRRSFLQFLGLALIAPTTTVMDWGRMTPEAAAEAVESVPMLSQWCELMDKNFPDAWKIGLPAHRSDGSFLGYYGYEPDRIPPALRT
jgi:hypothetical protein